MTIIPYLVAYLLIGLVIGACLENLYIIFDLAKNVSLQRWWLTTILWPMFVVIMAYTFHKTITKKEINK